MYLKLNFTEIIRNERKKKAPMSREMTMEIWAGKQSFSFDSNFEYTIY